MLLPPRDAATRGWWATVSDTDSGRDHKESTKFSQLHVFNAGVSALASVGDVEGAIQVLSSAPRGRCHS
jgi:hypothetical protein